MKKKISPRLGLAFSIGLAAISIAWLVGATSDSATIHDAVKEMNRAANFLVESGESTPASPGELYDLCSQTKDIPVGGGLAILRTPQLFPVTMFAYRLKLADVPKEEVLREVAKRYTWNHEKGLFEKKE